MTRALLLLALSAPVPAGLASQHSPPAPEHPRAVLRLAAAAVRGDSADTPRSRWQARLARDSSDRAAALGLATLARLTYDYPAAERLYRRLASPRTERPDLYAVYARLGLALGLEEHGAMAEVDTLLAEGLSQARALGDPSAEGEALLYLGYARSRSRGIEIGVAYYDSALRALPAGAAVARATARCRRAQLLVILGRGEREADLARAWRRARETAEPRAEAPCVRAMAIALGHRDRGDSAEAIYQELADRMRGARDRSGRANTLVWRASVLRQDLAAHGEAREVLRQAEAEARHTRNQYAAAIIRLLQGQIHLSLNDHQAATGYLDEAVAAATAVADSEVIMVSRSWRALANLAAGDFRRARQESLGTLEYFRRQGDLENQSEVAQTLANIAIRERDWTAAEAALDSSEALLRRLGANAWRREQPFERGRLALFRGDYVAAGQLFGRYLQGLDSAAHLQRHEALTYLADAAAGRGDLAEAELRLAAAADDLERWRATLNARDLRITAFQANASAQNDRNASVARVLAALSAGGRAEAAFALAERRRARELTDRLLQNAALETRPGASRAVPRTIARVSAADVAAWLPDGTALVEYVTGAYGAPTTVFTLTRAARGGYTMRAHRLPPADSLTGRIARFLALIARGEDVSAEARVLGGLLLDPAVAGLGPRVKRLVIVPDGALHRVPWDALRLRGGRWAVERWAIGIAPSAALVTALWRAGRRPPGSRSRVLAFGDPVFPAASGDGMHQAAFTGAGGMPRLRGSGREVARIARWAPGTEVQLRESASESHLKRADLAEYRVLHFATHAVVDDRVSVRTALALAPGGGEDGFVTPGELARLRLAADLVVLSACRTAGGVVVDGEGVQGLTAPLLEAGARSVVATTWRVGDESTVDLVDRFYAGLARGLPVADALQAAKLEAILRRGPPAGWAAFTVVGDPLTSVPLRPPGR